MVKRNTQRRGGEQQEALDLQGYFFPEEGSFSSGKASKFVYELPFKPFTNNFTDRSKVYGVMF
jgi:hypothetical protein